MEYEDETKYEREVMQWHQLDLLTGKEGVGIDSFHAHMFYENNY